MNSYPQVTRARMSSQAWNLFFLDSSYVSLGIMAKANVLPVMTNLTEKSLSQECRIQVIRVLRLEMVLLGLICSLEVVQRVPLTTVGDLQKLINDIDAGKHDELLSELTNEDRMETLEALGSICNSIKVDRNNADVIPCKVSYADDSINLNVDESTIPSDPIVQSVDINKSTSYAGVAGGSAKDQPNINSNFRTLVADPVFDGVNISIPHKVVEKKWLMDTRLLKEELTRISIWVKLHDVPIQVFKEDGISLIAMFIGKSEADLVDVVTIGIPSLSEDDFTKETISVDGEVLHCCYFYVMLPLLLEKTNDGFQTVGKKKKRKVIQLRKDNLSMYNSFSALNEEEDDDEEDVENVYDGIGA
ncbi:zinc knuckle CX2CX4HX4C containing protein [Tanacetum coccineum]